MLFSSLEFLLLFFPIVFVLNYLLPVRIRNYWLLLTSLFFYAWGEPDFVWIMVISILINYVLAIIIDHLHIGSLYRKLVLIIDIALNLGMLLIFKYLNFITSTIYQYLPSCIKGQFYITQITLPIGISFFTFQALSYVIDVYRKEVPAQRNIGFLGLYISLFPQLIAGPIVRYTTVMDQISQRNTTFSAFSDGMIRFMTGFNKKMLLANVLAEMADAAFSVNGGSVCMAWLGTICYALQIYYDFSGYSDMAIGLGRILGFRFLENFNYPYISQTITEFWRRWHISLGSWFRDYVYFPLGGSRVRNKRLLVRNLLIVWLLTGIWHGANWTFILWGVLYGIIIIIEKITDIPQKVKGWPTYIRIIYRCTVLFIILIGWVLFRAEDLSNALIYFGSLFGQSGNVFLGNDFIFYVREYVLFLVAGLIGCFPLWLKIAGRIRNQTILCCLKNTGYICILILFIFSFSMLIMNAHNPFIYFNF